MSRWQVSLNTEQTSHWHQIPPLAGTVCTWGDDPLVVRHIRAGLRQPVVPAVSRPSGKWHLDDYRSWVCLDGASRAWSNPVGHPGAVSAHCERRQQPADRGQRSYNDPVPQLLVSAQQRRPHDVQVMQ
jgi:hypothetical protein